MRVSLCLIGMLCLVSTEAEATILANWSLDDIAAHADAVVIGRVTSRRVTREGPLWTETEVRVERQLKGTPRTVWTVSQLGGKRGDLSRGIAGDVELRVGQRVLLMLERVRDGRWMIVGLSLGAFRLDGDTLHQQIDVPLADPGGRILPPPGDRSVLLEAIETAVVRSSQ